LDTGPDKKKKKGSTNTRRMRGKIGVCTDGAKKKGGHNKSEFGWVRGTDECRPFEFRETATTGGISLNVWKKGRQKIKDKKEQI